MSTNTTTTTPPFDPFVKYTIDGLAQWQVFHPVEPADPHGGLYLYLQSPVAPEDDVVLYGKLWAVANNATPKATMTFVHGLGEHILRYDAFFTHLSSQYGIQVFAWDQRGFGRSAAMLNSGVEMPLRGRPYNGGQQKSSAAPGEAVTITRIARRRAMVLGDLGQWPTPMEDIARACLPAGALRVRWPGVPHFLMGHSMGGSLVTLFACHYDVASKESPLAVAGLLLSAPAYRPGFPVPWLKRTLGSALSRVFGTLNMSAGVDATGLSRDLEVVQKYIADPYVHGLGSLRTLACILDGGEWMIAQGWRRFPRQVPFRYSFGTQDRLTNFDAAQQVFQSIKKALVEDAKERGDGASGIRPASKQKQQQQQFGDWQTYEGFFHELHNEPEKKQVWDDYAAWILDHS